MKTALIALLAASTFVASAQQPALSTSDKVAVTSLEQAKQKAQQDYAAAQQTEDAILQEWAKAHPGYHINPQSFAVEAEPKAAPAAKK